MMGGRNMYRPHRQTIRQRIVRYLILGLLLFSFLPGRQEARGSSGALIPNAAGGPPWQLFVPVMKNPAPPPIVDLPAARRVNAPSFSGKVIYEQSAIFWFGAIGPTSTYVDVRVGYNQDYLEINVNIIDRLLWKTETPTPADFPNWDSLSLYINKDGNSGESIGSNSYRFDAQLNPWQSREDNMAGYYGNGNNWILDISNTVPFSTTGFYRGSGGFNNGQDNAGWDMRYRIQFSALGLSGPPPQGTIWGLGVVNHNRVNAAGPAVDETWPEHLNNTKPSTWGQLHFGLPVYTPPASTPSGSVLIREKANGPTIEDAGVGGGTVCGGNLDFWTEWGNTPNPGSEANAFVNIQNQKDVADWPCFSKFYITFPLDLLPAGKVIRQAQVTLYQFGNSGGGNYGTPGPSYIQALTEAEAWSENTLTWNNAPLALENISGAWADALTSNPPWPGVARTWDVSRAVAQAYSAGKPLRLVFYESDSQMHSGKYFVSSETGDWNERGRPALTVELGNP